VKPKSAVAWLNRGLSLQVLERYEDAVASFDKVIELDSQSHKAWNYKGYMLVQLEKDQEALECFDNALEIKPDFAAAFYNKASCYALQAEVKLAAQNLQQAIDLNPRYREEVKSDPDFEGLVDNDRFWDLMEG
jgi:tetratricopeptide (TPR) repeat protein